MREYTIKGKKYYFIFSINAIRAYMNKLAKATEEDSSNSVDEVQTWIEFGLQFGCQRKNVTYDLTNDDLADWMDENFDEVCDIGGHCRKQMIIFNNALTGQTAPESKKKVKE